MSERRINVVRISHVHYQVPDLEFGHSFLLDFGFIEAQREDNKIFYRGFGLQPCIYILEKSTDGCARFLGATWVTDGEEEFQKAASHLGAGEVRPFDGPGQGMLVTIQDPNGMNVGFISGQKLRDRIEEAEVDRRNPQIEQLKVLNLALEKGRHNFFHRFEPGPSPVHKLGHYGFVVPKSNFAPTVSWYMDLMNLRITDAVYDPKTTEDETCFFRIDLGEEFTDHHASKAFFLAAGPEDRPTHIHHSSFEVNDFDTESLGHDWLRSREWENCWGIGRHVLGSQIFDYWFDSAGFVLEHYSDGDLVNCHIPLRREPAAKESLYVWGPNVPLEFISGHVDRLANAAVAKVAKGRAAKGFKVPDPYETAMPKPRGKMAATELSTEKIVAA